MTNINDYKDLFLLFSQYALTIANKHEDKLLLSSQYTLTNTNNKANNFIREEVWLRSINYSLLVTK